MDWSIELPVSQIQVNRDGRQRKELTDIEDLMSSIQRRGQIQPIVITRDFTLVAGERRFTAITRLADRPIRAVFTDEVDPLELRALEFEENSKRLDLPWQDNCLALLDYHELRKDQDPTWTLERSGEALGISHNEVSKRCEVARALRAGNPLVLDSPKLSTAAGIVSRQNERKAAAEVSQLMAMASGKSSPAPRTESSEPLSVEDEVLSALESSTGTGYILNEDFAYWADTYDGPRFNLIHCDFPYGVGMHKSDQGSGDSYGTYEDTPEIYWSLLDTLLNNVERFCDDSAHLIFWFSMDYYHETFIRLSSEFRVNPFPLVWVKSDNSGILPDPNRGPRRTYETAFFASRGDRKVVRPVSNHFAAPIQRGRHMSEKPQDVLRHFFRMVVDEHSAVLDPTCGSGSAIRAAIATGASRYLGLEINTEFADHADEVLQAFLEEQG